MSSPPGLSPPGASHGASRFYLVPERRPSSLEACSGHKSAPQVVPKMRTPTFNQQVPAHLGFLRHHHGGEGDGGAAAAFPAASLSWI